MKKISHAILWMGLMLFILNGCSQKESKVDVEHQKLIWHDTREKPFGIYDYSELSKKEAKELLENKFSVQVPSFVEEVENMLSAEIITDSLKEKAPVYSIFTARDRINVRGDYQFYQEEELKVFAFVDLKYIFDEENKEVRLATQSLSMSNYGKKATYPKDNFEELLMKVAQIIDIPKRESDLASENFVKDYQKEENRPGMSTVVVYGNDNEMEEKQLVSQTLRVGFNSNQEAREIYGEIVDYTK